MSTLLTTKFAFPPIRSGLVARPHLIERLNEGTRPGAKLTLVSAPAGYGKTTLVSEWIHRKGGEASALQFVWLSLDEGDNDPARFFAYLVAALQTVDADIGQSAQGMLQAPQPPPPESLLTALLNDVAATPQPFVLVLDDYHLIHTLPIHQQLAYLLEHQPSHMRLVITTREDPPLPLSRLRVRGQMVEVREADLRFTKRETAGFLASMQLDLTSDHIAALQQRTEGWIAGLQLAALSLRGSKDVQGLVTSFAGSNRYVLDYLVEEVFRQQSETIRSFLLQTSILERLTAPLCDALLDKGEREKGKFAGSQEILTHLEHANLFIVPLDTSRQWYRYHRLFADLLRHRLEAGSVYDVARLHRRASQWYADNGFPGDAVGHALEARDWDRAIDLIVSGVSNTLLKRGEMATLLGWLDRLPDDVVRASPQLCLEYSWPLILTEQLDAAESYLAVVEQAARAADEEGVPILGAVTAARVHIARMRGDAERALSLSEQALALLPEDDMVSRAVVALNLGMTQWYRGRLTEAQQTLAEAARTARGSGNDYALYAALTFLCRIEAAKGYLHRSAASCRERIRQGGQQSIGCLAHYDLARLLYEWNDLDEALEHLEQGLELCRLGGSAEFLVGGYSTLAVIEQARGGTAAAQAALAKTVDLLDDADISVSTRMANLAARIVVALAQGDMEAAALAVGEIPPPDRAGSFPDYMSLMLARARFLLAQNQHAAAAGQLTALLGMASQAGWQSMVIQARALQALTFPEPEEALAALGDALDLAEPEGYVRTFVDAGEPMEGMLQALSAQLAVVEPPTGDPDGRRLTVDGRPSVLNLDYVHRLLKAFDASRITRHVSRSDSKSAIAGTHSSPLVEPLSDRELDVLRLLADGQTNQEIALALSVSINTVKTHLKNIYGKLEVGNRRQAVARARALDLIP
jgi:LuxR family maltose regulon positive regulatory protein